MRSASWWITSKGLAAKRRVRPPSSETKRVPSAATLGMSVHHGGKRASMAHADQAIAAALDEVAHVARAGDGQRAQRQGAFVDVRHHLAELQPEGTLQFLFEVDAAGDRAFDEDPDEAFAACPRDQPMGLGALHAEQFRHLALGLAAGEMQPRGAGGKMCLLVHVK